MAWQGSSNESPQSTFCSKSKKNCVHYSGEKQGNAEEQAGLMVKCWT